MAEFVLVLDFDKDLISEAAKYYADLVSEHVLCSIELYQPSGTLNDHIDMIEYYVENELYYNRADDYILEDISHQELKTVRELVKELLIKARTMIGDRLVTIRHESQNALIRIFYE